MNNLRCPRCGLSHIKRNGHTHYQKQNYQCLSCRRQFVKDGHRIDAATRALVQKLLLERVSLRGICRVLCVSLVWLLKFMVEVYEQLPDDLYVQPLTTARGRLHLLCLEAEADELWSFVGSKANKQWVWLAFDPQTKQVLAFYVGDRSRNSARQLWKRIPRARSRASDLLQPMTGKRIVKSFPPSVMRSVTKAVVTLMRLNVSTALCGSGSLVWYARRSHFPRN